MKNILGNRTAFWLITLGYLISVTLFGLAVRGEEYMSILLSVLVIVLSVLFLVSSVCRCHELNWSGWRVIIFPVPLAGTILLLELLFLRARKRVGLEQ